jgi:mRNA-degrading endonuclease toxin of MazEF toxin-antitoxin module
MRLISFADIWLPHFAPTSQKKPGPRVAISIELYHATPATAISAVNTAKNRGALAWMVRLVDFPAGYN